MGFLVDPHTQTVTDVHDALEAPDTAAGFLERVKTILSGPAPVKQLNLVGLAEGALGMFIDNWGLLRGSEQRYWRFKDGEAKVAGKALILAIDNTNGYLAPIRADALETIRNGIVFLPDVTLSRIEELILTEPGEVPRLVMHPHFSDERLDDGAPPPAPVVSEETTPPPQRWVVSARPDKSVKAVCYALGDGDALVMTGALTAANLEDLQKSRPPGLVTREAADDDPPEILEYWLAPDAPAAD